jgi:hypothetical protein
MPDPAVVLDLIEAFRRSKVMFAAVSLGVFDALTDGPQTGRWRSSAGSKTACPPAAPSCSPRRCFPTTGPAPSGR